MARRDSIMRKPKDVRGSFRRLMKELAPFKKPLIAVFLLCLLSNVLALLGPSLAGAAINEAAAGKGNVDFDRVTGFALRMLFCYVTSSLLSVSINMLMVRLSKRFAGALREKVFHKLMTLPVGYFDRNQAGDIISRVSYDIDVISTCMSSDITAIMTSVVTVVGSLMMMIVLSPVLALVGRHGAAGDILHDLDAQKDAAQVFKAEPQLRHNERLRRGDAVRAEVDTGLRL